MKRSKLAFLAPCLAVTSFAPVVVSCAGQSQAEKIVDAIFNPLDLKSTPLTRTFKDSLKTLSQEELNNELVYDLFAIANEKWINDAKDLYRSGDIQIQTNITKISLAFNNDNLYASFLGYVSFVFTKDRELAGESFKTNDYIMLTYDFLDLEVEIDSETECSLCYSYTNEEGVCLGFAKIRNDGGQKERLHPIEQIKAYSTTPIPKNSKNWYVE